MDWRRGSLRGHSGPVTCLCADGALLYSGAEDRSVRVWDPRTDRAVRVVLGLEGAVAGVQIVGSRLYIASGSGVSAFDLRSDRVLTQATEHCHAQHFPSEVVAFAAHHSGGFYVVADEDGGLTKHDLRSGESRALPRSKGHTAEVSAILFRPNSSYDMATAGFDNRLLLWDSSLNFPRHACDFGTLSSSSAMTPPFVLDAAFACAGKLVLCALGNGNVSGVNSATGESVLAWPAHRDMCTLLHCLAAPDTRLVEDVVSAGADRMVLGWRLSYTHAKTTGKRRAAQVSASAAQSWAIEHSLKMNAIASLPRDAGLALFVADTSHTIAVYSS